MLEAYRLNIKGGLENKDNDLVESAEIDNLIVSFREEMVGKVFVSIEREMFQGIEQGEIADFVVDQLELIIS